MLFNAFCLYYLIVLLPFIVCVFFKDFINRLINLLLLTVCALQCFLPVSFNNYIAIYYLCCSRISLVIV